MDHIWFIWFLKLHLTIILEAWWFCNSLSCSYWLE